MPQPKLNPNALALARVVAIQAIRFVRTSTQLLGLREDDKPYQLRLDRKFGGTRSPDVQQGIRAIVSLECVLLGGAPPEPREVARVSCDLALEYAVRDADLFAKLTDEDLAQFAASTGQYNAWPFLREFCQTASLRMALPIPIVLPTLPPVAELAAAEQAANPPP